MKQIKTNEKSAGKKRLMLTFVLYKIFGSPALYITAFFVSFFTFVFSKDLRRCSKQYLSVIFPYTGLKPSLINQFRHVYSFAESLADKIIMYSGNFNPEHAVFEDKKAKDALYSDIREGRGVCFLFPHSGCIEILLSFFQRPREFPDLKINIFRSRTQTKIFDSFIDAVKKPLPAQYINLEDFGAAEAVQLKCSLEKGEVLFIAGDRLPSCRKNRKNRTIEKELFGHKIYLPQGAYKLAELMETPVYYIAALKSKKGFIIQAEKLNTKTAADEYTECLKKTILKYPLQFYHFYNFFSD